MRMAGALLPTIVGLFLFLFLGPVLHSVHCVFFLRLGHGLFVRRVALSILFFVR